MKIGVPKELFTGERRVALTPDTIEQFRNLGFTLAIESGAGAEAGFPDEKYAAAGVEVISSAGPLWESCDIVMKVRPPTLAEVGHMHAGQLLIGFIWPAQNKKSTHGSSGRPESDGAGMAAFRASPARKSATRSHRCPTLPDTAPSSRPRGTSADSSPVRLPPRTRYHPARCS